jgi:hypothetical protein
MEEILKWSRRWGFLVLWVGIADWARTAVRTLILVGTGSCLCWGCCAV